MRYALLLLCVLVSQAWTVEASTPHEITVKVDGLYPANAEPYTFAPMAIPAQTISIGAFIDRKKLKDPSLQMRYQAEISTDGGATWGAVRASGDTIGGQLPNSKHPDESGFMFEVPPCQPTCHIQGWLQVIQGTFDGKVVVRWVTP